MFDPSPDNQWRASLIALLFTLLLHIVLLIVLPDSLLMQPVDPNPTEDEEMELVLETIDPEQLRYVEANPEAPENEPDRKDRYSFRAQQSADENPETSQDDSPTVEGSEASQKIVQGSVDQQEPMLLENGVVSLFGKPSERTNKTAQDAQASSAMPPVTTPPAPDFIRQTPEIEEGPGSSPDVSGSSQQIVEKYSDTNEPIQLYRPEADEQANRVASDSTGDAPEAKPLPRARPRLPPDLVQGPLMRSTGSARRRGTLAIDSTFSQFGEYEQQFYAAVQAGWYQEIDFFQPIDTSARVVVQFRIQADGTVDEVVVLNTTAGEIATLICQTALTKRSPFRPWTEEMVQVFGRERVMKVAFSYL